MRAAHSLSHQLNPLPRRQPQQQLIRPMIFESQLLMHREPTFIRSQVTPTSLPTRIRKILRKERPWWTFSGGEFMMDRALPRIFTTRRCRQISSSEPKQSSTPSPLEERNFTQVHNECH